MADVVIPRYDAASGWLPAICPRHGIPADRAIKRKFKAPAPGWVWLLILVSWLIAIIAVIAANSMEKSDEVSLPACQTCSDAAGTRARIRWGSGLLALAGFVAAIVMSSGGMLLLSLVVALVWLLAMSSLAGSLGVVTGSLDGGWLRLKGVHPAFVAAMRPNPAWNYVPQPSPCLGGFQSVAAAAQYWPPPGSH